MLPKRNTWSTYCFTEWLLELTPHTFLLVFCAEPWPAPWFPCVHPDTGWLPSHFQTFGFLPETLNHSSSKNHLKLHTDRKLFSGKDSNPSTIHMILLTADICPGLAHWGGTIYYRFGKHTWSTICPWCMWYHRTFPVKLGLPPSAFLPMNHFLKRFSF